MTKRKNKKPREWTEEDEQGYQRYLEAWQTLSTMTSPLTRKPVRANKRYTPPNT